MGGLKYALVLVLTVQLALWGAFLVPLRIAGAPVPVGLLLALTTAPLCRSGIGLLGRRAGGVVPMLLWAVVAVALSTRRPEGDLVITGGYRGIAFLLVGLLAAAVSVGAWQPARRDGP